LSEETFVLGRSAAALGAAALVLLVVALAGGRERPLRVAFERYGQRLDRTLRFLRSPVTALQITVAQGVTATAIVLFAVTIGPSLVALLVPVVAVAPRLLLDRRAARRTADVEAQLEAWLGAVANALKASPSLGEAIASTSRLVPMPINQEIDLLVRENELGTPLDEALQRFADRIPSQTVAGAVLALKVARRTGGNLPEMLETAGAALRELARLEGVVRSKTAEGKAQALVVGVIPFVMVAGISWLDPQFFEPLAGTFTGHLVVAGAGVLWALAMALAWKILAVDV
jgi:tight adherence protein B